MDEAISIELDGLYVETDHEDDDGEQKDLRSKQQFDKVDYARSIEESDSESRPELHLGCARLLQDLLLQVIFHV